MHRRLPSPRCPVAVVVLALVVTAVAACGPGSQPLLPGASTSGEQPALVTVEYRGGHCREGECRSVVTISPGGTVQRDLGPVGPVPQPLLTTLVDAIRTTDFAAVLARPFTGECPTAYDGQELVFTIATPNDGHVAIASCEVEVDPTAPLFAAIERIVEIAP